MGRLVVFILFAFSIILSATIAVFRPGRHYYKLKTAKRVYMKIQGLDDACVLPYLRKIDPYVFEELVLWAFKQKGYRVYRNARYSGDGGVDGKVRINGKKLLIQDKRYSGYIQLAHIKAFDETCRKKKQNGLFIHTGKTGQNSKDISCNSERITIISGTKLIQLLKHEKQTK